MAEPNIHPHFAICIEANGWEDLQLRKLYAVLPDEDAARSDFLRVVDDSGEDYLYPASCFLLVDLPASVEEALAALPASA